MRILVAMMKHETNTFSPIPTSLDRFFEWGGHLGDDAYHAYKGTGMPFSAYIDVAEASGHKFNSDRRRSYAIRNCAS